MASSSLSARPWYAPSENREGAAASYLIVFTISEQRLRASGVRLLASAKLLRSWGSRVSDPDRLSDAGTRFGLPKGVDDLTYLCFGRFMSLTKPPMTIPKNTTAPVQITNRTIWYMGLLHHLPDKKVIKISNTLDRDCRACGRV